MSPTTHVGFWDTRGELLDICRADGSEGNYESLRILAFDCLLVCRPPGRDVEIDTYLADVVRNDTSLALRRHVARALSEAILLALALGEVAASATAPSIVDITNDTDQAREQRSEAHNGAIVKALRKEFSKKLELRDTLQAELLWVLLLPTTLTI